MNKPHRPTGTPIGKVRLIGGRWRGTRLAVPDAPGLRPTSDRVRETLFNWLMPVLPGARVLDLFAGSGALGLEALSRGAANAVLVERDPVLAQALRETAARLQGGEAATVVQADALAWLTAQPADAFDLAFVDPPFAAGLWNEALPRLLPRLAAKAWLYLESPPEAAPVLPPDWELHREGRTREVRYALYRRRPGGATVTLAADPAGDATDANHERTNSE
ncbi:MAG TPA: 16S rRNA (guanine(966)-N(2))-methyltransferase RsmD [Lysobacter sp.]